MTRPALEQVARVLRPGGLGLLLGTVWGIALRLFMRLISDAPEFSWGGTLAILGFAAAAGLGLGLVRGARRAGRSPAFRWFGLLALPLVLVPQGIAVLLPAAGLGGLALSGRSRPAVRVAAAIMALAIPVGLAVALLPPPELWIGFPALAVLLVCMATLAAGAAEVLRRWRRSESVATPDRQSVEVH